MNQLSDPQIVEKLASLDGWKRNDMEGQAGIMKVFPTGNFLAGLGFVTRVAVLAEAAQSDALFPEHRLYLPEIRFARARWLLTTGDTDAGAKLMASAVAEARSIFGPDHPVVRAMVERSGP